MRSCNREQCSAVLVAVTGADANAGPCPSVFRLHFPIRKNANATSALPCLQQRPSQKSSGSGWTTAPRWPPLAGTALWLAQFRDDPLFSPERLTYKTRDRRGEADGMIQNVEIDGTTNL